MKKSRERVDEPIARLAGVPCKLRATLYIPHLTLRRRAMMILFCPGARRIWWMTWEDLKSAVLLSMADIIRRLCPCAPHCANC